MTEDMLYKIRDAKDMAELKNKVGECVDLLEKTGHLKQANEILKMVDVPINKFSKQANNDTLGYAKNNILECLSYSYEGDDENLSEYSAVMLVKTILDRFQRSVELLFHKTSHGKCSDSIRQLTEKNIRIENEYDFQHILYPFINVVFPLARTEQYQDTGHSAVRKDIIIQNYDIAIELKCTYNSMDEAKLGDEIAADIVHYDNRYLFFFIYDKAEIIDNMNAFIRTYENQNVAGKRIYVQIMRNVII